MARRSWRASRFARCENREEISGRIICCRRKTIHLAHCAKSFGEFAQVQSTRRSHSRRRTQEHGRDCIKHRQHGLPDHTRGAGTHFRALPSRLRWHGCFRSRAWFKFGARARPITRRRFKTSRFRKRLDGVRGTLSGCAASAKSRCGNGMKLLPSFSFCLLVCTVHAVEVDDLLDRLDTALTLAAFQDNLRARLSGTIDLEAYHFQQPAPGLIDSKIDNLFNPRLTLFLDAQLGSQVYFFAQARVDRGFDPSNHGAQVRLDEYALRFTPWEDGRFTFQAGKFATVIGNWVPRHLSWENPFINAPLIYENVTPIQDKSAPASPLYFIYGFYNQKYAFNPVIWGPSYASGVSVSGRLGQFDYAAEMKNASLSSRPESWNATEIGFDNPTVSARIGFRPNQMWNFGFSASDGAYFRP